MAAAPLTERRENVWINAKYGLVNTNRFAGITIIGGRIWAISGRGEDGDVMIWETGDGGMNTPEEALGAIMDGLVKARPVIDLL